MGNAQHLEGKGTGGNPNTLLSAGDHLLSGYSQQGAAVSCPSGNLGMTLPQVISGKVLSQLLASVTTAVCGHL